MPSTARYGFQETGQGINFWFVDREGVANILGPVTSLEPADKGDFRLETANGARYRVLLNPESIAEFRRLGGIIRSPRESGPTAQRKAGWGFQKTEAGILFWFRGAQTVRYIGPIVSLVHLQDNRYALLTRDARHPVRLAPENVAEFRRLGGTFKGTCSPDEDAPSQAGNPLRVDRKPLLWQGLGQKVQVGSHQLVDPLTYFSQGVPCEEEPSCINLRLPVGKPVVQARGELGYWPQYSRISPDQRANYLAWLAGGRKDALDDIGYAFIYFYGHERRVLVDKRDINPVIREIVRLLNCYTFSGAFTGHLSRFLAYVIAQTGLEKLREEWFNHIFEQSPIQPDEEILALALAWHVKCGQPLSPAWAQRMAKQHPQAQRSVVVERVPEQFALLFAKKYKECFGEGLQLRCAKRDRKVEYKQPANPSLLALRHKNQAFADAVPIPNVLGLQSQFLPLVRLWADCIKELRRVKGDEVNTRADWEALPPDLKTETEHPDKPRWEEAVADGTTEEGIVVLPIFRLATIQGFASRLRLTAKQSESLAQTAQDIGYCIEPDARITGRPHGWDDRIALFRPDGHAQVPADGRYASAAIMLELGLSVAAADGVITDEEMGMIGHFVENQFRLDQAEVLRLKHLKQVFLQQPPSLDRLSMRLVKVLDPQQRETLGQLLFAVAAANAEISEPALKTLRKAYRALHVDVDRINDLVRRVGETKDRAPAFPAEEWSLDQKRIAEVIAETQAVQDRLGQVFKENGEEVHERKEPGKLVSDIPRHPSDPQQPFPGLPERFQQLLAELLHRDQWSAADFESLVRSQGQGLMPGDSKTRINEWAEENLGDSVIEEGDPLVIHRYLLRVTS